MIRSVRELRTVQRVRAADARRAAILPERIAELGGGVGGAAGEGFWAWLYGYKDTDSVYLYYCWQEVEWTGSAWEKVTDGREGTDTNLDYAVEANKIMGLPPLYVVRLRTLADDSGTAKYVFEGFRAWKGEIITCSDASDVAYVRAAEWAGIDADYAGVPCYNGAFPWHRPGDAVLVAPYTHGTYCGEIVQRIEGAALWKPPTVGTVTYDSSDDAAPVQDQPADLQCDGTEPA